MPGCAVAAAVVGSNGLGSTAADGSLKFRYCSLVAATDGTVFIQSYNQVWQVTAP